MTNEPITIIATVQTIRGNPPSRKVRQDVGKIVSTDLKPFLGHSVRLRIEDLGLPKKRPYLRNPTALGVTIDYLNELLGEEVNHTELFNRIYEETGKAMKDDDMHALIDEARRTIESWGKK